jgi:hypothetical protein
LHVGDFLTDRPGDNVSRYALSRPVLGNLHGPSTNANHDTRYARAMPCNLCDRVRADGVFGKSRRAKPVTDQPCDVRLGHRLELDCAASSQHLVVADDGRDAPRDARMPCQDDRQKTTLRRLQPGQGYEGFQHVVSE